MHRVLPRQNNVISIHAPREGDDDQSHQISASKSLFQSTPPARGTTRYLLQKAMSVFISIHAPREGDDNV